jgi:hypothetical protein
VTPQPDRYEIAFSGETNNWHIERRYWTGDVENLNILAERYVSEEHAKEALAVIQKSKAVGL